MKINTDLRYGKKRAKVRSLRSGFRQLYQVKVRKKRMEEVLCSSKNCYMEPFYISNEGNLCV